jgi:tetratricopeptide (TPR) repeat protein
LRALGYVAPTVVDPARSLGVVGGPDPKDEMGLLLTMVEAETALTAGRPVEALALLRPLGEAGEVGAAVSALRAAAAIGASEPGEAERDARAVIEAEPGRADVLVLLGQALEAQGRFEEAAAAFRSEAGLDERSGAGWTGFGRTLEQRGRGDEAAVAYEEALERVDPTRAEASWRLAALEIEAGRREAAELRLGSLASGLLAEPSAAIRLAYAEHRTGSPERALERLREARNRHPDHSILARMAEVLQGARE